MSGQEHLEPFPNFPQPPSASPQKRHQASVPSAAPPTPGSRKKRRTSLRKTALLGGTASLPLRQSSASAAESPTRSPLTSKKQNFDPFTAASQSKEELIAHSTAFIADGAHAANDTAFPGASLSKNDSSSSQMTSSSDSSTNPSTLRKRHPRPASRPLPTEGDEGWDYAATARWGWVVLSATWIVFVVGMGSALDVWHWAWDVGETPYAPPELEDDPTLPVSGYYPALVVLTAVVAWVWVVVAWVGMKYFRHAKMGVEEEG